MERRFESATSISWALSQSKRAAGIGEDKKRQRDARRGVDEGGAGSMMRKVEFEGETEV